jgi:hypothetical protein
MSYLGSLVVISVADALLFAACALLWSAYQRSRAAGEPLRAGLVLLGGSALLAAVAFQQAAASKAGLWFTDVDLPWYSFVAAAVLALVGELLVVRGRTVDRPRLMTAGILVLATCATFLSGAL